MRLRLFKIQGFLFESLDRLNMIVFFFLLFHHRILPSSNIFELQALIIQHTTQCIHNKNKYKLYMIKNSSIKIGIKIKPKPPHSQSQMIVDSTRKHKNEDNIPTLTLKMPNQIERQYLVDAIHDANISKSTTFKDLHIDRFVQKFIQGFNVTIMAYGQTGAGKTFTMEGNQKQPGIIQESIRMIYEQLEMRKQNKSQRKQADQDVKIRDPSIRLSCSYLQLYNQLLQDLLGEQKNYQDGLKLRWQADRQFIVEDLSSNFAYSSKQMETIWKKGTKRRIVAANNLNDLSSRSHTLFSLTLTDTDEDGNSRTREMIFVDLAGSQRIFDSVGKINKESVQINKSLFVLRKVIKILQESSNKDKTLYIPYRDSKLTSLLKKSLGGNCLTMMIACIDPTAQQKQQTLLTLSYAISTGHIHNTAKISIDPQLFENKQLKAQNQKLRKQLQIAWSELNVFHKERKSDLQKRYMGEYSHKIIECIGTIRQLIKSNKELREELDEERKVRKQQQLEIEMLMQEKSMTKRLQAVKEQSQSLSPTKSLQNPKTNMNTFTPIKVISAQETINKLNNNSSMRQSSSKFVVKNNTKNMGNMRRNRETVLKRKSFVVYKTEPNEQ